MSYVWKSQSGAKIPMREMTDEQLQSALQTAERRHVENENQIQNCLRTSKLYLEKALQIKKIAKGRGIQLDSLPDLYPGKFQMIRNTYHLLEVE